jgi:hypothetical protein
MSNKIDVHGWVEVDVPDAPDFLDLLNSIFDTNIPLGNALRYGWSFPQINTNFDPYIASFSKMIRPSMLPYVRDLLEQLFHSDLSVVGLWHYVGDHPSSSGILFLTASGVVSMEGESYALHR